METLNSLGTTFTILISLILCLLAAFMLSAIARWSYGSRKKTSSSALPPGSLGLPFLGETLQLFVCAKFRNPWDFFYHRQTRYGPVYKTSLFGGPTIVLDAPLGNQFLFANHGTLVITVWPSQFKELFGLNALFFLQGLEAKRMRQIFMSFLGPHAMEKYVGRMSRLFEQHVQECWVGREQVQAYLLVKSVLFSNVCNLFFSLEDKQLQEKLLTPFTALFFGLLELPIDLPWTAYHKAKLGRKRIDEELDSFIGIRRIELREGKASETQDLLSVLLTTCDEDGKFLSDNEIKDSIVMLLFAGHDSTSATVTMAIKYLSENPACYELVLQENLRIASDKGLNSPFNWSHVRQMKYTWRVLQETLRLSPPSLLSLKKAITDFRYGSYNIPKGWKLLLSGHNTHRKEQFFSNPHKFDPNRFEGLGPLPNTYVPFGGGPRMCPGIELAKTQALVFLHHLILRIQWSQVDPKEKISWHPIPRPKNNLKLHTLSRC